MPATFRLSIPLVVAAVLALVGSPSAAQAQLPGFGPENPANPSSPLSPVNQPQSGPPSGSVEPELSPSTTLWVALGSVTGFCILMALAPIVSWLRPEKEDFDSDQVPPTVMLKITGIAWLILGLPLLLGALASLL